MQISDAVRFKAADGRIYAVRATFGNEGEVTAPAVEGNRYYDAVMAAVDAGSITISDVPGWDENARQ